MSKVLNLPERQDAEGTWHMVLKDVCGWCGCAYLVAEDDHDLVWRTGRHHDKPCSDDECDATPALEWGGATTSGNATTVPDRDGAQFVLGCTV